MTKTSFEGVNLHMLYGSGQDIVSLFDVDLAFVCQRRLHGRYLFKGCLVFCIKNFNRIYLDMDRVVELLKNLYCVFHEYRQLHPDSYFFLKSQIINKGH